VRAAKTDQPPTLSRRALNRALLERQLLLARSKGSIVDAVERVGGLQTQYAPSGYIGLWTRVAGFQREDLTRALEDHSLIQASLMRTTIHIVPRSEYWLYANGIRRSRQEWVRRVRAVPSERRLRSNADRLRDALRDGPKTVKELGDWAKGFVGTLGLWVDLVRVPPSGTWDRRRADRLALAEDWVGPNNSTEEQGLEHLVRTYLRAFGPATWKDVASWAGLSVADIKRGAVGLDLATFRDDGGAELFDLAGAELPDASTKPPVRFLPHWDANLLVHARRAGILPEEHRPRVFSTKNPFSVGACLVGGRVVGAWSLVESRIVLDPFETMSKADQRAVEAERRRLEAFHG
jgi:hypothetical protein